MHADQMLNDHTAQRAVNKPNKYTKHEKKKQRKKSTKCNALVKGKVHVYMGKHMHMRIE